MLDQVGYEPNYSWGFSPEGLMTRKRTESQFYRRSIFRGQSFAFESKYSSARNEIIRLRL